MNYNQQVLAREFDMFYIWKPSKQDCVDAVGTNMDSPMPRFGLASNNC